MGDFDTEALLQACPSGPAAGAWRTFLEKICGLSGPATSPGKAAFVWVADVLRREAPAHPDGVSLWVTDCGIPEAAWSETVRHETGKPLVLSITDGYIVGVPGAEAPFNLATGKVVNKETGKDWFRVEVINLRALFQLCSGRAREWTTKQQKSGQTPTPPRPAS